MGNWRKALWLGWLWPVLLFATSFFLYWPMDGDETLRLAETKSILSGSVPFFDSLMVVSFPGFWVFLAPIVSVFSPSNLLPAARIFSLTVFFLSMASIFFVQRRVDKKIAVSGFLISLALLFLTPTLLYKVAECRPDGAAGLLLLTGGAFILLSDSFAKRIAGLFIIGCSIALRLEYAVAILPLFLACFHEVRRKRLSGKWFIGFGIPVAVVFSVFVIVAREKVFALLLEMPLLINLAQIGKGSTVGQLNFGTLMVLSIIGIFGAIDLARRILNPNKTGEASFSIFILGSALVLFAFHLAMGAKFLQNYWIQVYLLSPYAGLFFARFAFDGHPEPTEQRTPAWLLILVIAIAAIGAVIPVHSKYYQEKSIDPKAEIANWNRILMDGQTDGKLDAPYEYYKEYSLPRMVHFIRRAHEMFGEDAVIYSNDFRFLFGHQIPVAANGKMATLIRVSENGSKSETGQKILRILNQRFPSTLFILDGIQLSPAEFISRQTPDILVADDVLKRLVVSDNQLKKLLNTRYRIRSAPGMLVVFTRTN